MISGKDLKNKNIISAIKTIYQNNYGNDDTKAVEMVMNDIIDLFNGKKIGFQSCDVKYHDIFHTLQIIAPFVETMDGWNKSGNSPIISKNTFDLGIIAVMLHDTGYIKTEDDNIGTGAKYTFIHIERSINFAEHYLYEAGYNKHNISIICNAIRCTGVDFSPESIDFHSEEERLIGYALGTADLLGQMSAPDYPGKLPSLFKEFEEAYHFESTDKLLDMGIKLFNNANELVKNTKYFYETVVMERLSKMGFMYKYLTCHFGTSCNPYLEAIENNIKKIQTYIDK